MKKKFLVWTSIVVTLGLILTMMGLHFSYNKSSYDYSMDNILTHIETISKDKHSIYDTENIDEVRDYIKNELDSYGVDYHSVVHQEYDTVIPYTQDEVHVKFENIYVDIKGESDTYILLMAHFDSSPRKTKYGQVTEGSHGAMDDGYGVANLLEIARILSTQTNLKNGVKIAFLDGEEVGMKGSYELVDNYSSWLTGVNFVINVESRGNRGPLYVFRTNEENTNTIKFFKKAGFPFAFSMASDIFGLLPNATDFDAFLNAGYAGVDMANIDSLKYYHNQNDIYDNINKETIKKYQDTLLPLIEEYVSEEKYSDLNYFESESKSIFFTLFPDVVVSYSENVGWIFCIILLVAYFVINLISLITKNHRFLKSLLSSICWIMYFGVSFGLGYGIIKLLALVYNQPFNFMFTPFISGQFVYLVVISLLITVLGILWYKLQRKMKIDSMSSLVGAEFVFLLLYVASMFVLPGVSFALMIPLLVCLLIQIIMLFKSEKSKLIKIIIASLGLPIVIYIYNVIVYSIFSALSFGSLGLLMIFQAMLVSVVVPSLCSTKQTLDSISKN